ncbi:benzoate-CoA ligase family protein [Streptomyces odontomachi]|uniref:benzoate-CoA ligase family protein n=1 Tax=Streptomyces odontomachi TaxID=2944940 RepID=UPI00210CE70D|nr:benzoate-CoA ligase family protein [Streptomyces sp. ODS25]
MAEVLNATDYLLDRHLRAGHGARTALVTPERTLTYGQLADQVHRVAAGLRALGVRPEERVVFCMTDDVELVAGILAALRIGAVATPVSTMLTGPELGTLVADARCRVVLASQEFAAPVRAAVRTAPEVEHTVLTGEDTSGLPGQVQGTTWQRMLAAGAGTAPTGTALDPYPTWPDSPALWLYTSGTTGLPKAAMHRHTDITFVAEAYGRQVLGLGPEDRCLSVAKLFFAYGIGNSLFFPLAAGATALLEPSRPSPALFARRAAADRATVLFGMPSFFGPLLADAGVADGAFATVRQGVSAGEALPARMYHGMLDRFGVEVLDGIGSTEMLHIFLSNRPGRVHPNSSGEPVPGYAVELRDAQGGVIEADGTPGELYVRGESAATGYWCRAQTSRQVFLGDWVRTGDTYLRNPDGTYTCMGRTNDLLKAGGIWVAPAEVEERLLAHPDVAEVAVVGVPDADGLDKPVACVVPKPGCEVDAELLVAWCRETMAAFKRPRAVVPLPELPRTPTGKIRRAELRAMLRDADGHRAGPVPPSKTPA